MTKQDVIDLILKSEGGLNEQEPESVGGVSYAGITQKAYAAYFPHIQPHIPDAPASVRGIVERGDVIDAFYELYLSDFDVWILPDFLQYMYADFVVNAGGAAVKIVQRLSGCNADGVFGSGTRAAVIAWTEQVNARLATDESVDNSLIMEFHAQKLEHYDRLVAANPEKFGKFHKGWIRRANHVLSQLQEYFETDEPTPSAMDEADVPVSQPPKKKGWSTSPDTIEERVFDLQRQISALTVKVDSLLKKRKFEG